MLSTGWNVMQSIQHMFRGREKIGIRMKLILDACILGAARHSLIIAGWNELSGLGSTSSANHHSFRYLVALKV